MEGGLRKMNDIEYCIRNAVDYALLTNDALGDNKITLVEYECEINRIIESVSGEIQMAFCGVEIL